MTNNNKLITQIIEDAENLDLQKVKESSITNEDDRLLYFITRNLSNTNPIENLSEHLTLEEKLFFNKIHPREIDFSIKTYRSKKSQSLALLLKYSDNSKIVTYTKRGQSLIYCPATNRTKLASEYLKNKKEKPEKVYELYRHLPYKLESPIDILSFSFGKFISVLIGIIIVSVLVMCFNLTQPIITQFLTSTAIPSTSKEVVIQMIWPALIIAAITGIFQYFQALISLRLETEVDLQVQTAVWERTLKLPLKFMLKYTTGDMNSRISAITTLRQLLGNQALTSILSFLFSFIYFIMMYITNPSLTWIALAVTIMVIIIGCYSIYKQSILQWPLLQQQADLTSFTFETINGVAQIRSTETEPFIFGKWFKEISNISYLTRQYTLWTNVTQVISSMVQPLGATTLFGYIVYQLVFANTTSLSNTGLIVSFFPFYAAYSAFNQNMVSVFSTLSNIGGQVIVNWRRAKPVLFQDQETGYGPDTIVRKIKGDVEFNDVKFRYDEAQKDLFTNLTFKVSPGSLTAITGESGCGKSTVLSMLLGFYEPVHGSILIDGLSITDYNIRQLRKQIGVVMQLAPLPSGTIYKIVSAGLECSEDEVWDALKNAAVDEQIKSMPLGLDTVLNESSQGISGGQRQRIAIARAIISKPKILLMDEATSALDNESQKLITENLSKMKMTRIVIAHRLSTIADADQVIYLGKGTVQGSGKFSELLERGIIKV